MQNTCRRETGSISPTSPNHSGLQRIRLSGGAQRASTEWTLPLCSWAQKCRTSAAKRKPWREGERGWRRERENHIAVIFVFWVTCKLFSCMELRLLASSIVSHNSLSWGVAKEKNCSSLATNTTYNKLFLAWAETSDWAWANQGHVRMQANNSFFTCPWKSSASFSAILALVCSCSVEGV